MGAFVDRSDPWQMLLGPGYWQRERQFSAWSANGVRARVGATHVPLSELVGAVVAAGLIVDAIIEVGEPTPDILCIRAHRATTQTYDEG